MLLMFTACLISAQDKNKINDNKAKEFIISYTTGTLDIETNYAEVEVDYETIGGRFGLYSSQTTQWGGYYEIDLEDSEINLLGAYIRSYLQQDQFSPYLELDLGMAMGDEDSDFFIGGMIGGKYVLDGKSAFDLGFRYLYSEGDDIWLDFSSFVLGYSFSLPN